jgi:hypothetical protein
MLPRTTAYLLVLALFGAVPARGQERDSAVPSAIPTASELSLSAAPVPLFALVEPKRPPALPVLYGSFATFQALDIVSTQKAKSAGAKEMNPMMGGTGQMIAMKAATSVFSIYLVEKTWKKNRTAAIMTMVAINGMSAAIAAHNFRNARAFLTSVQ